MCFSSVIDDIVFGTTDESGILVLDLICGGNRVNVLEETMYADLSQNITVCDLSELVEPYAREYLHITMECSFTDTLGSVSISPVTILYGKVDVDTTAAAFTQNHFLSILGGEKLTALGRAERLHAYNCSTVTVRADVQLLSGQYNTLSEELHAMDADGSVSHFDVSPDNVVALIGLVSGTLLGYTVEAGNRSQQFRVVTDRVPPAPSLLFINSFGYEELLHCVGTHKKDSKYERKQTRIMGRLKNYRITEERQFNANTGWLNEAMADCMAAREKHGYYQRQVNVLREAYTGTHELMDNGKASYLEVLKAQESLLDAQLAQANNMYDAAKAVIALYIALGGGGE